MRDAHLAGTVNKGAGVYGYPAPTHVTRCVNSKNPYGHNRECPCGWYERQVRDSQRVPYLPPEPAELHEFFD